MDTITYENHTYEIVDEIPVGYLIWNIGEHAPEGYLPLCKPLFPQPFPGSYRIDGDTLKAIKADDAQVILTVVHIADTLPAMETYVKRHDHSARPVTMERVKRCREAIPALRKVKGWQNLKKWEELVHEV